MHDATRQAAHEERPTTTNTRRHLGLGATVAKASRVALGLALLSAVGVVATALHDPHAALRWGLRLELHRLGAAFEGDQGVVLQRHFHDCGPAALATLLLYRGREAPSVDSLARWAGTTARGTNIDGLARAAARANLPLRIEAVAAGHLGRLTEPVIAWVHRSHFVVVVPATNPARRLVLDPQIGRWSIAPEGLARIWSGVVLRGDPASPSPAVSFEAAFLPTS